jgi:spore maturation protein CgeB
MRNYEVLSCGGFYLCHYTPASEHLFVEGEHLELARSEQEAVEKAKFYIQNETERKRIARKGHEFVRKYHTYERRVLENLIPFI